DRGVRADRRGALRGRDGVPGALLYGDERAGGDAPDRASHGAAGPSLLPPRLPADAPAHRREGRTPRNRRRDALRRSHAGRTGTAGLGAVARTETLAGVTGHSARTARSLQ